MARLILILLTGLLATGTAAAVPTEDSIDFYVESYGALTPEDDPRIAIAYRVFERVRAAADQSRHRPPRLVVIGGDTNAWAIALPSGHIVLSRKAVALCFKQADENLARTRLAFVLGHELAHLAHDDYWHEEVERFLAASPDTQRIAHFLDQNFEVREKELAADDKGYIYAAMAGYPVHLLLERNDTKTDFFTFWMQQTQARISASHPFPEDRAALLRERLRMLQEKVAFFDMGARLVHFGRCSDAIYFLREFQQVFPGPAVLNDLGVCALQQARQAMPPRQAHFYWLPFLLDLDTRMPRTRAALPEDEYRFLKHFPLNGTVTGYLRDAADYLERAAESAPDYLPARINLATVQLYLGRPHQARAALAEALKLAPDDWQAQMLDALALYEQSDADIDLWPAAVKRLETRTDMPPAWRYNLARLLDMRPRNSDADQHWNQLAALAPRLPRLIREQVCRRQRVQPQPQCLTPPSAGGTAPLPWSWPVPQSGGTLVTPSLRARLFAGWESIPFDWFRAKLYGFIHRVPHHTAEVMEMDQYLQLQVTRTGLPSSEQAVARACPQPLRRRRIFQGTVVTCGNWAVLLRDGRPREAWWISR
ncbi:hypothetical protein MIT9_P0394 [Methylomarinovum caldicuralii]|uniref:Peptidase M48 domain-containing protein n=1 Tax=Methylomarinovum caldicuralii TaxID=438856 RepID=A0AAU9BZX0_9GAMM|nr:M48 family metalloprotease [Methylomarinovum caldicuralii]BCX80818.1 hypothetical protein MIT9_P0394 [Methylomarinovum caldicuralii]